MIKKIYEIKAILVLVGAFLLVFTCGLMAEAQEAANPDGEFELAVMGLVDAFKIGQVGLIIMALVQLVKTRLALMLIAWVGGKLGWAFMQKSADVPAEPQEEPSGLAKYLPVNLPKLPGAAVPATSVLIGGLAGVAESIATGKPVVQAVFEGLLSSGVAMGLYDFVLKPIINKFKK